MSQLKLCPMNRMSECVKEKCAWWVPAVVATMESGNRVFEASEAVNSCSIREIARGYSLEIRKDTMMSKLTDAVSAESQA